MTNNNPPTVFELLNTAELAEFLDAKASEVRNALENAPDTLPIPLRFNGRPYWPLEAVVEWSRAGSPRGWTKHPSDYVASSIWRSSDEYLAITKALTA
jgi:hypothetical protein